MGCKALTFSDGGWFCQKCGIGGDKGEPVEEYCKGRGDAKTDDKPAKGK